MRFTYQKYISDLNGIDPKAHNNEPLIAIQQISEWLRLASGRKTIPGCLVLKSEYIEFSQKLPSIVKTLGFNHHNLPFSEYRTIVEEAVRGKLRER